MRYRVEKKKDFNPRSLCFYLQPYSNDLIKNKLFSFLFLISSKINSGKKKMI